MNESLQLLQAQFSQGLITITELYHKLIWSDFRVAIGEDQIDEDSEFVKLMDVWIDEDNVQARIYLTDEHYNELVAEGCEQY